MKYLKLYENQKNNINKIRKELGLDKMYLYRFVGNTNKIKKMPYEVVLGIARIEKIEPNELYNQMLNYSLEKNKERN